METGLFARLFLLKICTQGSSGRMCVNVSDLEVCKIALLLVKVKTLLNSSAISMRTVTVKFPYISDALPYYFPWGITCLL